MTWAGAGESQKTCLEIWKVALDWLESCQVYASGCRTFGYLLISNSLDLDRDASRNMLPASHPLTGIPQPEGDTSWGGHSWGFVSPEPNLLPRSTQHLQHHFWSIWECTTPEWHTHCTFLPLWTRGLELTYPCFPFICVSFLVIIDMFRRNIVQRFFFCLSLLAVINID